MSGALLFFIAGAVSSPALFGWWDGGFWTLLVIVGIAFLVFSRRGSFPGGTPQAGAPASWGPDDARSATPPATAAHFSAPATVPGDPADPAAADASANDPAKPPLSAGGAPTTPLPGTMREYGPFTQEHTMNMPSPQAPASPGPAGFGPPPPSPPPPHVPKVPKPPRHKALPGYAATIVLGLAVLLFALVTGLSHLGMLELPADAVAVGFAVALIVIALGLIGAALNQRTGGALVGFGIVALVFSLLWGGGSLRDTQNAFIFPGIISSDSGDRENVFSSGSMDLRSYSTITEDTEVQIDNVFSSMTLTVPDNIPVAINTDGVFSSLTIEGNATQMQNGQTVLNADAAGPTLELQLDGVFSSLTINVAKAEVAP